MIARRRVCIPAKLLAHPLVRRVAVTKDNKNFAVSVSVGLIGYKNLMAYVEGASSKAYKMTYDQFRHEVTVYVSVLRGTTKLLQGLDAAYVAQYVQISDRD